MVSDDTVWLPWSTQTHIILLSNDVEGPDAFKSHFVSMWCCKLDKEVVRVDAARPQLLKVTRD